MTTPGRENREGLVRFAWLSIAAAVVTMALKAGAYLLTDSVGLLSDALESGVNLTAGLVALTALKVATQPPDQDHAYGHDKAEYFSSGAEGILILLASAGIIVTSVNRLLDPSPLYRLDLGLAILGIAALINFVTAQILMRSGRRRCSVALEADAHHLMTDVWTSLGVLAGIGATQVTGWYVLDPIIALLVAAHITWVGLRLLRRSALGLMDTALPAGDLEIITGILDRYSEQGIKYHALRTRQAGARNFVSVHIQVPGEWSVRRGHDLLEEIESAIRNSSRATTVFTHLEPLEDPASWADKDLDHPGSREESLRTG